MLVQISWIPKDFTDPLPRPPGPPAAQSLHLLCEIFQHLHLHFLLHYQEVLSEMSMKLLDGLTLHFMSPSG